MLSMTAIQIGMDRAAARIPKKTFPYHFFWLRTTSGMTTSGKRKIDTRIRSKELTLLAYWGLSHATMAAMRGLASVIRDLKLPYHYLKAVAAAFFYQFPAKKLRIIGVTGTDGKTTTSTLIYSILKAAGRKAALITTVSALVGGEEIDTGFHVTSPSPFALQKLLHRLAEEGYTDLVLEVTSHGIHQFRVWSIEPEVTVLTNITHEHLDYHGTYEEYVRVKSSFIAKGKERFVNSSDASYPMVRSFLEKEGKSAVSYELKNLGKSLQHLILEKFVESYNQMNATAACFAALAVGATEKQCAEGLAAFSGIRGRMEFIGEASGVRGYVDFAHTPNSLMEALSSLRKQVSKGHRLIAVFGAAGQRDLTKRPMMGKIASELADETVLTSEDPRGEDPEVIIHQIKEGISRNWGHVFGIADRRKAIQFAFLSLAKPGDLIAVFGKGHERTMNLDGKHEVPWSDQEEVLHALHLFEKKMSEMKRG